jgi:hypothetical protein
MGEFFSFIWSNIVWFSIGFCVLNVVGVIIFNPDDNKSTISSTTVAIICAVITLIVGGIIFSKSEDRNISVKDRQAEYKKEEANSIKNRDEVINAVLYKYGVGSTIKGYTITNPTGYCQVNELPNYSDRNKRKFTIGFHLTNGRVAYLSGIATKKDGEIKVNVDEVVLE